MFKNRKILLPLSIMALVGLIGALMIGPVSAGGQYEDLTAGSGTITLYADYDGNIKTDNTYGALTVMTNGFDLNGNIEHKGSGALTVWVEGTMMDGNIKNEGGAMTVIVDGHSTFTGNVEHFGSGGCSVTGHVMGSVVNCP